MKPAIEVKNISKSYIINHKNKASYSTLKDDLGNIIRRPFGKQRDSGEEQFWALKNINFEVPPGEIFGVIGKNGSGKSTLLKILSRIVDPTEGSVHIRGRVASLLEVGTGFHPELTGRENIYFNGSMLGMSRNEVTRKFNEIVEFSEIEKFIDTPVKFYSSGMYVRLAFSVAAHLDPEILILDEVLAVGDASFQKKSMNKILSTMREGRTVLFVSHNTSAVRQLCTKGILLNKGHVEVSGNIGDIIDRYMIETMNEGVDEMTPISKSWEAGSKLRNDIFEPQKAYISDEKGVRVTGKISNDKDYWVAVEGKLKVTDDTFNIGYAIWDADSKNLIYQTVSTDGGPGNSPEFSKGNVTALGKLPKYLLNGGNYKVIVFASLYGKGWIYDMDSTPVRFEIEVKHGTHASPRWTEARGGLLAPMIEWRKG